MIIIVMMIKMTMTKKAVAAPRKIVSSAAFGKPGFAQFSHCSSLIFIIIIAVVIIVVFGNINFAKTMLTPDFITVCVCSHLQRQQKSTTS